MRSASFRLVASKSKKACSLTQIKRFKGKEAQLERAQDTGSIRYCNLNADHTTLPAACAQVQKLACRATTRYTA